jgi:hypothetical protein
MPAISEQSGCWGCVSDTLPALQYDYGHQEKYPQTIASNTEFIELSND